MVSRLLILVCLLLSAGLQQVHAAAYKLANGQEISGELLPTSANEQGVQVKVAEGQYEKVLWENFSQEELKKFSQNPKLQPFVEPFIEITQEEKLKQTEVKIKLPERLEKPKPGSILVAMFSSLPGVFMLLVLYAATIYAGLEVAYFRAQPPMLVAGLAAIPFLGILSPIAFLAMPTRLKPGEELNTPYAPAGTEAAAAATAAAGAGAEGDIVNPMQDSSVQHPSSLHLTHEEKAAPAASLPEPVIYQRGQFTFNRRFFETKFSNFFGVVRHGADKDLVIFMKATRGTYIGQRISRVAANDLHLEVHHAGASQEVMIPYIEVQEVRLQHKDTKS